MIIVLVFVGTAIALLLLQVIVPPFRYDPNLQVNRENPGLNVSSLYQYESFTSVNTIPHGVLCDETIQFCSLVCVQFS